MSHQLHINNCLDRLGKGICWFSQPAQGSPCLWLTVKQSSFGGKKVGFICYSVPSWWITQLCFWLKFLQLVEIASGKASPEKTCFSRSGWRDREKRDLGGTPDLQGNIMGLAIRGSLPSIVSSESHSALPSAPSRSPSLSTPPPFHWNLQLSVCRQRDFHHLSSLLIPCLNCLQLPSTLTLKLLAKLFQRHAYFRSFWNATCGKALYKRKIALSGASCSELSSHSCTT